MILIIGYGNTLREDDGAGPRLAEIVGGCCRQKGLPARVLKMHQLVPELAADIARPEIDAVVFTDTRAALSNNSPDEICIDRVNVDAANHSLGHHLGPATLLVYAQALFGYAPPGWLATVPGINFDHGEALSSVALQALDSALPIIDSLLDEIR